MSLATLCVYATVYWTGHNGSFCTTRVRVRPVMPEQRYMAATLGMIPLCNPYDHHLGAGKSMPTPTTAVEELVGPYAQDPQRIWIEWDQIFHDNTGEPPGKLLFRVFGDGRTEDNREPVHADDIGEPWIVCCGNSMGDALHVAKQVGFVAPKGWDKV